MSAALDLIRAMGWLDERRYVDSPRATPEQLARFHDPDYIAAVLQAEADQRVPDDRPRALQHRPQRQPDVSARSSAGRRPPAAARSRRSSCCATAASSTSPAGGTHHGRPDRASGFCYFNDPVLGILALLDQGLTRVSYVDVDAHHGDGVQDAFADDARVFTLSIHEERALAAKRRSVDDRAGGSARNLPVPAGFNDSEMAFLFDEAVLPLAARLRA